MLGSLRLRLRLPRLGRWPRLLLAATCLLLALGSALGGKRGSEPAGRKVAVVVAARDLPAGHTLARHDLRLARWPPALRPPGSRANPADFVGRRLAGPLGAREAVTVARLVGSELATGLRRGLVAAAVTLDDPHAADLVRPGSRIDLLEAARPPGTVDPAALPPPTVRTVAAGCLVLAVLPPTSTAATELVLAVDPATAARIVRDTAWQVFTAVVRPP